MQLDSVQILYKDLDDLIAQLEFLRGNPAIGRMTEIDLKKRLSIYLDRGGER